MIMVSRRQYLTGMKTDLVIRQQIQPADDLHVRTRVKRASFLRPDPLRCIHVARPLQCGAEERIKLLAKPRSLSFMRHMDNGKSYKGAKATCKRTPQHE